MALWISTCAWQSVLMWIFAQITKPLKQERETEEAAEAEEEEDHYMGGADARHSNNLQYLAYLKKGEAENAVGGK